MSAYSKQESLDFGRLHYVAGGVRSMYRALNDAVDAVGVLPAAGACGADRGDLRKALDRDGRFARVEWAMAIAAIAAVDARRVIAEAFVAPLGLELKPALAPLTPEQENARLRGVIAALGPLAEQYMRAALEDR